MAVVYKSELEKYNPDYEKDFGQANNRAVIEDFDGEIDCKKVPVETEFCGDLDTVIDTVITGTGNINFRSCYGEDLS